MSKCELLLPLQPVPSTTLPDLKHTNKKMFCFERIMKWKKYIQKEIDYYGQNKLNHRTNFVLVT